MTHNRKMMLTLFSLAPLLASGLRARAAGPALPKPVTDMECLVGKWAGQGTLKLGAETANVKLSWDCHRVSGSYGVECAAVMKGIPGVDAYQETDLFGYEPGTNTWHWFSVTNAGETHDHRAPATPGKTIAFVHNGVQDGKPLREVVALTFGDDEKSLELSSETFVEGKSAALLKGTATKK